VGRDHEGGPLEPADQIGEGEGLAAPGDPEEHAVPLPRVHQLGEALDGPRLIARGREVGNQSEQRRQKLDGTATRYLRQESRKEDAWGCRRRWTEKRNCGC